MKYTIHYTKKAALDLYSAAYYIKTDLLNPQAAYNLIMETKKRVSSLEHMPEKHPLLLDPVLRSHGLRCIVINNYLVFFIVEQEKKTVHIIRYIYGRRDWISILHDDPLSLE